MLQPVVPFALLLLFCWGCEPGTQVTTEVPAPTEAGAALLQQVVGSWRIEGSSQNTCPQDWTTTFPFGETRWSDNDGQLLVEDLDGGQSSLSFWPEDGESMSLTVSISSGGCEGMQQLTLELYDVTENTLHGTFTSLLTMDSKGLCVLPQEADAFPCITQFTWQAIRR